MTKNEFNIVFNRICKYYDKNYKDDTEMIDIYFNEMKRINDRYSYFEELLYKKFKFFPKITEIIETKYKMDENKNETVNINRQICECEKCNGIGYRNIIENRNKIPYTFLAACNCKNGDNKLYDGSKNKEEKYRTQYVVRKHNYYIPA